MKKGNLKREGKQGKLSKKETEGPTPTHKERKNEDSSPRSPPLDNDASHTRLCVCMCVAVVVAVTVAVGVVGAATGTQILVSVLRIEARASTDSVIYH